MRPRQWMFLVVVCLCMLAANVRAQAGNDPTINGGKGTAAPITWDGFSLTFVSNYDKLTAPIAQGLIERLKLTIGPECEYFNPDCPRQLTMIVQATMPCADKNGKEAPACAGPGATPGTGEMHIDGKRLVSGWNDYDMVTHEAMHIVQSYPFDRLEICWWWQEGEADLGRYWYGSTNEESGWYLPQPNESVPYTEGYTYTAAFLNWIYNNWTDEPIYALHRALQAGQCPAANIWQASTGFATIDALWLGYLANNPTPPNGGGEVGEPPGPGGPGEEPTCPADDPYCEEEEPQCPADDPYCEDEEDEEDE